MEVIIVLIIVGVVGYFIYQSLPNTKYAKAENLFNTKDYSQAINILNEIIEKHEDAPAKLAECKLSLGQQASGKTDKTKYFNEVTALRKKISNSASFAKFDSIEAKALFEISKIQYEEAKGNIEKFNKNIRFIDTANQKGSESNFSSLKTKHFNDLSDIHFINATQKEKSGTNLEVIDAIQIYTTAKDFAKKSNNNLIVNNSASRILICQLKLNQSVNLVGSSKIEKSDKNYQKELYFRYAIQLLKNKEFSEAEKIISLHLNFQSSDIEKLKDILKTEKINNAVKTVTKINTSIDKLYNNALATKELKSFYDGLDIASDKLGIIDYELSEKIADIKPTLFNRLLIKNIENEEYNEAINVIQKYPEFWKSTELLKNFGICSYGLAAKGLLSERNYKTVISGWLTSVFSDNVILKSLDDTAWDDNYTFSLAEAIGSNHSQHEAIPENVNYDEVSETNISIGATQKELLQQFETIIQKEIQDASLSKLVNDFYDTEKEAIVNIIAQIENDSFFAAPYFAISNGMNNEIISELDKDYHDYSNEDALEAGIPYIKNSKSTVVYQYFYASDLINKLKTAINNENKTAVKRINSKNNKQRIERFDNINNSIEDNIFNTISNKISRDENNKKLIPVMEECIAFLNQNDKLKHQYSNYVSNYCILNVNDETINNCEALLLMKGAYNRSRNNPKIVKNFITLIKRNLMDIVHANTTETTAIYSILDWVKSNMSQTYKQNSNELSKARREIIQQFQQEGMDISLFDDSPLSNARAILSGRLLTLQGIKIKHALNYLKELGGNAQESTNPLDTLSGLRQQLNLNDDDLPF